MDIIEDILDEFGKRLIRVIPPYILDDKEFCEELLSVFPSLLPYVSEILRDIAIPDKDLSMTKLQEFVPVLSQILCPHILDEEDFCKDLLFVFPSAFPYISKRLLDDKDFVDSLVFMDYK